MKYLFILGRNPELSIAELKAVFEFKEFSKKGNSILVELDKLEKGIIEKLGGVIAIGEVFSEGVLGLDDKILSFETKNKLNYVIWNFSDSVNKFKIYLKKRFKSEKLKATEKNLNGILRLQNEKEIKISKGLIDEEFFVFDNYFGKIIETCDYNSLENRDMKKPVRREELSISPRLAKIMINLSQIKKGGKLLDGFCGIGVILQEALLQKIKVVGIDVDINAIKGARKNLEWFEFSKKDYKLINSDLKKVDVGKVDVMVSEPDLGKILKRMPTEKEASDILNGFENLMIGVLKNINTLKGTRKNISGKIVFSAPLIKVVKGRKGCNWEKISKMVGLKIVEGFPIQEFRKDKIVGREIFVFEDTQKL